MKWLIWSFEHNAWWRPDSAGYTTHVFQAGQYDYDTAEAIVSSANIGGYVAMEAMLPDFRLAKS